MSRRSTREGEGKQPAGAFQNLRNLRTKGPQEKEGGNLKGLQGPPDRGEITRTTGEGGGKPARNNQ